jgi:hypothetical protein
MLDLVLRISSSRAQASRPGLEVAAFGMLRVRVGWRDGPAAGQQLPAIVEQHDTVTEQAPALLVMGSHDAGGAVVRRQSVRAPGLMLAHVDLQLENDPPYLPPPTIAHRLGPVVMAGGQLRYLAAVLVGLQPAPPGSCWSATGGRTGTSAPRRW